MTAEDRPVRERLAEVLAKQCGCTELTSDRPDIEAHLEDADAILSDTALLDDLCRERIAALFAERDRLRAALAEIHNLVVDLDTTAIGLSIESIARHALRAALDSQEASGSVRAEPDEPNRTTEASE